MVPEERPPPPVVGLPPLSWGAAGSKVFDDATAAAALAAFSAAGLKDEANGVRSVSYTHLTLPTILRV